MDKLTTRNLPKQVIYLFILTCLLGLSLAVLTVFNYFNTEEIVQDYMTNAGISIALEVVGRTTAQIKPDMQKILDGFRAREGVTYISIVTDDHQTVAGIGHTEYVGNNDAEIDYVLNNQKLVIKKKKLSNGQVLYQITMPLHVDQQKLSGQGAQSVSHFHGLCIGLNEALAGNIIRPAQLQVILIFLVLIVFAYAAFQQLITLQEHFKLLKNNEKQENLAAIGMVAAGVAHEIRNPLGAIKGITQLIQEDLEQKDEKNAYLETIIKETLRLERFVDVLLDYTKAKRIEKSSFVFEEMMREVIDLYRTEFALNNVQIYNNCSNSGHSITADRNALKQVLINIFKNAMDEMLLGGSIIIDCTWTQKNLEWLIRDTGNGVPPKYTKEIFQPFVSSKRKGVGLGLAICKQLIDLHGGTIQVENHHDGGAVFKIYLPLEEQ